MTIVPSQAFAWLNDFPDKDKMQIITKINRLIFIKDAEFIY
jgi:hypothetical protein